MVFIETSLFTRLINKYLSDEEYLGLQKFLLKILTLDQLFEGQVESENYVGVAPVKASVVVCESSITGNSVKMKSGC